MHWNFLSLLVIVIYIHFNSFILSQRFICHVWTGLTRWISGPWSVHWSLGLTTSSCSLNKDLHYFEWIQTFIRRYDNAPSDLENALIITDQGGFLSDQKMLVMLAMLGNFHDWLISCGCEIIYWGIGSVIENYMNVAQPCFTLSDLRVGPSMRNEANIGIFVSRF